MAVETVHSTEEVTAQESDATDFMLAEFNELGQLWRHTDARIESAFNFYVTITAILVSGMALLFQSSRDVRVLLIGALPTAGILLVIGLFLERRIISTAIIKGQYNHGRSLIRRYFVDRNPAIARYLHLPIASFPGETPPQLPFQTTHTRLILAVNVANALLAGGIVSALLWLTTSVVIAVIVAIGVVVSTATVMTLSWMARRRLR